MINDDPSARRRDEGRDADAGGLALIDKVDAAVTALEAGGELTAAELADRLGEPLSSTYRMLQSLIGVGWVDRGSRRGRYRLGLPMMTIGGLVEDAIDIREVARPVLESLLRDIGATSFLCIRRGSRAVCVEWFGGQAVRSAAMDLGSSLPLYSGAAPRALLAFLPESERESVLTGDEARLPGDPPRPSDADVRHDLQAVRRRGYSVSDEDVTVGIVALGAPVFNHRHELAGSIAVSGLRAQVLGPGRERNIRLLLDAARSVSVALGDQVVAS